MAVKANIIEGSSLEQSKGKISKTLVYLVTGVSGATTFEKEAAGLGATPAMGSIGPAGTTVVNKSAKIEGPDKVRVTLRYETGGGAQQADPENPTLPIYEVGTQLVQENTPYEADNITPIEVEYKGEKHKVRVTVDRSLYTLRITRVEAGIDPGLVALAVLNKLNSKPWQGQDKGKWKCMSIQGSSSDGGTTWTMVYEFLLNPTGHQPVAVLIDRETGEMYKDATKKPENGARDMVFYEYFDINLLGL